VVLAAAVSYVLPWGAARDVEHAARNWGADPEAAYDRLDRARSFNFLSDRADVVAGAIAAREGDRERMRESFQHALERNPHNWYALLELGALDALQDRREEALERLREAERLNPREPLIKRVARGARKGDPVSLGSIDRALVARVCDLVGRTDETRYCPED
jgi:tetratricopeptide (TPR) repeat protein